MSDKVREAEDNDEGVNVSNKLLTILIVGFSVLVAGIVMVIVASALGGGSSSFGGVIFIGPFPIVFGAGLDAAWLIALSILIAVLMFTLFLVMRRKSWKV